MDSSTWSNAQALAYIASYADLRRVFGANPAAGRTHYAQAGAAEGRTISFDALGYVASYSDLIAVFGANAEAATRHFIEAGADEGRSVTFDAFGYLASHADLRAEFGTDASAATRHFVSTGAGDGRGITFDGLRYIASYSDLIAAFGTNTAAATRHFVGTGAAEGRSVTFDALGYIASYSDLRAAFGTDTAAATRHFIQAGADEGRSVTFDAFGYLASHADLRAEFGTDASAATRHFVSTGAGDGRGITFDGLRYIASYSDLIAAFGTNTAAATRHFVGTGAAEGRSVTFDALGYIASYSDLRAAFGTDTAAATRHFIQAGADEGRSVTFDALGYIASYADLIVAFGSDAAAATRHFVAAGAAEGRVANGLISGPKLAAVSDSGVMGDNVTSDLTPMIEGLAAPGSLIKIYIDGQQVGTATASSLSGEWIFNVNEDLADGIHNISAVVGNSENKVSSVTIDTFDPSKPSKPGISISSDTGIAGDGRTILTTPTFEGVAEPSGTVLIYINGRKMASVLSDHTGAWSYKVNTPLSVGDHNVYIRSSDAAGNVSDRSDIFNLRIQSPVDSATLTTGIDDIVASDTGATVTATAATLTASVTIPVMVPPFGMQTTPGDRLVGGLGYDTLQLFGGGDFRIDQLGAFTGFERVLVTNPGGSGEARVYLGVQDIELGVSQGFGARFYLGSGKIDFESAVGGSVTVTSAANWNASNVIKGLAPTPGNPVSQSINLTFGDYGYGTAQTYDLRSAELLGVSINSNGNNTFLVNSMAMGAVTNWFHSGYSGTGTLSVADAAINLGSASFSNFKVVSTNATGTTFTTNNSFAALQVQGGNGEDTLVLSGSSFTADQRNAIFATTSIETITDASGRYQIDPNMIRLTTGVDQIITADTGATVTATAATLTASVTIPVMVPPFGMQTTPGDRLVGGLGYDTLQLFGGGDFRIDQLGAFTGFERVLVTNPGGSGEARVYLGVQDIELGVSQGFGARFYLGSGKIDFESAVGGSVTVTSAANWNASNVIKGLAPTPGNPVSQSINLTFGDYGYGTAQTYDLRSAELSWVSINSNGNNTFLVNSMAMGAVTNWFHSGYSGTGTLSVADAAINLGSASFSNFKVVSTNATGTTFTTNNSFAALQVQGGNGEDTLVLSGSSFTADQRNAIFATTSIETITDASGRYQIDPNMIRLTTGVDQIITADTGATVTATAATLTASVTIPVMVPPFGMQTTPGDRLVGGLGYDTLQLFGGGDFRIDQLGAFTGFERVLVTNPGGSGEARVYLGVQDIELGVSQGFGARFYLGSGKIDFESAVGGSVTVTSAANWNASNVIKGLAPTPGNPVSQSINLTFGDYGYGTAQTYDLRSAELSWVSINSNGNNTFLVNSMAMGAVTNWFHSGYSGTGTLSVADAAINLGSASFSNFKVVSTNATGTTFTTNNSFAALQVQGGNGEDTLVLSGSSFTADQRNAIFATTSIETITDASGRYQKTNMPLITLSDWQSPSTDYASSALSSFDHDPWRYQDYFAL